MFNIKLGGVSAQSYSDSCTYNSSVGNLSLSVQTYGEFYCTSAYRTERSGMNQHLLIYTLAGKGRLLYRRKEYSLTAGTLMLIDCAEAQVYGTDGDHWHFLYVHYTGSAAAALTSLVTKNENFCVSVTDHEEFYRTLCEIVQPRELFLPYDVLYASHVLEKLFLMLLKQQSEDCEYQKALTSVERALGYVAEHYGEKVTLDDLAGSAFLSKYHFLRLFSRITGMTPMEYLQSYRIGRAKIFLKTSDLSIEEIASKIGYENAAAFIRAFKKQTGTTPGKYKSQ